MKRFLFGISTAAMVAALSTGASAQSIDVDQIADSRDVASAWASQAPTLTPRDPITGDDPNLVPPRDVVRMEPIDPNIRVRKPSAEGQSAFTDQSGLGNQINIGQANAGNGAVADVIQDGNNNEALVRQRLNGGSAGDYAVVTSFGFDNTAVIRQAQTGSSSNFADIQQGNDGSGAGQIGAGATSSDNFAEVRQNGEGNLADVNQGEAAQADSPTGQTGANSDSNLAFVSQQGDFGEARIDQISDDHTASIVQRGGTDNEASSRQIGSFGSRTGHASRITQDGSFNDAKTIQRGESQAEETFQLGSDNAALTIQDGDSNLSSTLQRGNFNLASTLQNGEFNSSTILQDGDFNSAAVFQNGSFSTSAVQQVGLDNAASVVQTGVGDVANVQQFGAGNATAIVQ